MLGDSFMRLNHDRNVIHHEVQGPYRDNISFVGDFPTRHHTTSLLWYLDRPIIRTSLFNPQLRSTTSFSSCFLHSLPSADNTIDISFIINLLIIVKTLSFLIQRT